MNQVLFILKFVTERRLDKVYGQIYDAILDAMLKTRFEWSRGWRNILHYKVNQCYERNQHILLCWYSEDHVQRIERNWLCPRFIENMMGENKKYISTLLGNLWSAGGVDTDIGYAWQDSVLLGKDFAKADKGTVYAIERFDLHLRDVIKKLDYENQIYKTLASYDRMGRENSDVAWKKTDIMEHRFRDGRENP